MLFRLCLLSLVAFLCLQPVHNLLHQLPLQVDIKAQLAEKGKELQLLPILGRELCGLPCLKGFLCGVKLCSHILHQAVHLRILEGKDLLVDVLQVGSAVITRKILLVQRLQDGFDVRERKNPLVIVDEEQHQHMLPGIALLHRRRQKLVLRIVIDHGLGQRLVLIVPLHIAEMLIHEGCDLVHVQGNGGDFIRIDVLKTLQILH